MFNATNASFNSAKKKWKGPIAARPIGYVDVSAARPKKFVKAKIIVDWVILDEITEVVKFEAISLVDQLLLVNSPQKIAAMEKVKKHKHVVFAEEPRIIHFDKRKAPQGPGKAQRQPGGQVVVVETTTTTHT